MPRVAEFYGIVIAMYFNDHAPPHFHAVYAGREAVLRIDTLEILEGSVPRRALGFVLEWARLHKAELESNWKKARHGLPLDKIQPLD